MIYFRECKKKLQTDKTWCADVFVRSSEGLINLAAQLHYNRPECGCHLQVRSDRRRAFTEISQLASAG